MSGTDFDELVDGTGSRRGERERLRRDARSCCWRQARRPSSRRCCASLRGRPRPRRCVSFPGGYPRRRLTASVVVAAAVALARLRRRLPVRAARRGPSFAVDFVLPMVGTPAAPTARASLEVGEREEAGNWPMRMTVRNLPERPDRGRYELSLTQDGRIAASCGFFVVSDDRPRRWRS